MSKQAKRLTRREKIALPNTRAEVEKQSEGLTLRQIRLRRALESDDKAEG